MNVVIDSNIFFSALIRDSGIRRIILQYDGFFLFPQYIFEEIEEHKHEIIDNSGMSHEDFQQLLDLLLRKMIIVPNQKLVPYREEALSVVKDIDVDDVLFFACALAFAPAFIWSEDKQLKKQNKVRVLNTREILEML